MRGWVICTSQVTGWEDSVGWQTPNRTSTIGAEYMVLIMCGVRQVISIIAVW